jgi:predicted nucleotide-binding protein
MDLSEEELQTRIVEPWERGTPMTWDGKTAPSGLGVDIHVYYTADSVPAGISGRDLLNFMRTGEDQTNQWITVPAGAKASSPASASPVESVSPLRDTSRVMVVHGRNLEVRNAMFVFLRALSLTPIEWEDAIAATGMGSPHNLDAVRAAMDVAQAVIVLLTAEDWASLNPDLHTPGEPPEVLAGQPRQNVILEAGMAMGLNRERTILVQLGPIRQASDFDGLNAVRLTNAASTRGALRSRLQTAGCSVSESGNDWMSPAAGGDFEGTLAS